MEIYNIKLMVGILIIFGFYPKMISVRYIRSRKRIKMSQVQEPVEMLDAPKVESTPVENVENAGDEKTVHRRKKVHASTFGAYISRMRNTLGDVPIRDNALVSFSDILETIIIFLANEASRLVIANKKETMFASDIDTVIKLHFGLDDFTDRALFEAGSSLEKYRLAEEDHVAISKDVPIEKSEKRTRKMRSQKAGLIFSISRVENIIRENFSKRVAEYAPVFLASFIQEFARSVLQEASNIAVDDGKKMITSQYLCDGLHNIDVVSHLCDHLNIHVAGSRRH